MLIDQCSSDLTRSQSQKTLSDADKIFLLSDRNYDLVNLSDWESSIVYEPSMCVNRVLRRLATLTSVHRALNRGITSNLQQPVNSAVESGLWTQSIIWDRRTPFLDFTQLQLDDDDDAVDPAVGTAADAAKKEKEG